MRVCGLLLFIIFSVRAEATWLLESMLGHSYVDELDERSADPIHPEIDELLERGRKAEILYENFAARAQSLARFSERTLHRHDLRWIEALSTAEVQAELIPHCALVFSTPGDYGFIAEPTKSPALRLGNMEARLVQLMTRQPQRTETFEAGLILLKALKRRLNYRGAQDEKIWTDLITAVHLWSDFKAELGQVFKNPFFDRNPQDALKDFKAEARQRRL